jgi:hypothetical protein
LLDFKAGPFSRAIWKNRPIEAYKLWKGGHFVHLQGHFVDFLASDFLSGERLDFVEGLPQDGWIVVGSPNFEP